MFAVLNVDRDEELVFALRPENWRVMRNGHRDEKNDLPQSYEQLIESPAFTDFMEIGARVG